MNRRGFLGCVGAGVIVGAGKALGAAPTPLSERTRNALAEAFDQEMNAFMRAREIPGGALAVAKNGRVVYERGYGWADRASGLAADSKMRFRIASLSKPITAAAVLRLSEEGKLNLDAPVLSILKLNAVGSAGAAGDERWNRVTVRHLLQHTGGWDRDRSGDPMFQSREIAKAVGETAPASAAGIVRHMLGKPLDFDPGSRYAYSNFGYCLLGRVIERVSGESYETYVRRAVLAPIGIQRMRLGATLESKCAWREAHYYTKDRAAGENLFDAGPRKVQAPYGTFCLESMDSHGGWIGSASDLVRFGMAFDKGAAEGKSMFLREETRRLMFTPPPAPVSRQPDGTLAASYYANGWMVRPVKGGEENHWHTGSLPGTSSLLVRRWDGWVWAVVFNQRSEDPKLPDSDIDAALHRAADHSPQI